MTASHNIKDCLENLSGAGFIGIDTETVLPLLGGAKNPMKDKVLKRTIGTRTQIFQNKNGSSYEAMVRRRLAAQFRREKAEELNAARKAFEGVLTEEQIDALAGSIEDHLQSDRFKDIAAETFKVKPRQWGERIPNSPFISHVGKGQINPKYYLEVMGGKPGKVEYFFEGKPILPVNIEGFKPDKDEEASPNVQGGLAPEERVIIRTFAIDSIIGIRYDHNEWTGSFYYA